MLRMALALAFRTILSLRYRVKVEGISLLRNGTPVLLLSNHQALVDPQILCANVLHHRWVAPVVTETFAKHPLLAPLFRFVGVVAVADGMAQAGETDYEKMFDSIRVALASGKSVLLYPSGNIAGQGFEVILGKQSAYRTVRQLPPNVRVVCVRIRGLWGSMWSRAWLGRTPNLFWTYAKAAWYVLINAVFFVPKREVSLTFTDLTEDAKRHAGRSLEEFNGFLEAYFNAQGEEQVSFLKYAWFSKPLHRELPERIEYSLKEWQRAQPVDVSQVEPEVREYVCAQIAEMLNTPNATYELQTNLLTDVHLDSLSLAELVQRIRSHFPQASVAPLTSIRTVGHACLLAQGMLSGEETLPACGFAALPQAEDFIRVRTDSSLRTQMVEALSASASLPFCYDARGGTLTRGQFLTRAALLGGLIRRECPGERVGIMLPALQGTSLLIAACVLAGKTPVMFNWTVGSLALTHCDELGGAPFILTAKAFLPQVKEQLPPHLLAKCVCLEDWMKQATLPRKIRALLVAKCLRWLPAPAKPKHAVILFTSGSEANPKGVPLTEENILHCLAGTLDVLPVSRNERVLSFLPPFHSFGFTVATVLPLVTGLPVAYTPNPTDASAVAKMLAHTGATLLPTTPTFLKMLLRAASPEQLATLRTVVSGAEACLPEVREAFAAKAHPEAQILEGYGITECSPVISITPRGMQGGVGKCIAGLRCTVANHQTLEPVGSEEEGMLFVSGPSVFEGYLGTDQASPFVELDEQRFYRTGDLGRLSPDGVITITGRLKRFLKIGGEMISLPAMEQALLARFGDPEEAVLAVEGTEDPARIVLFTSRDILLADANAQLLAAGLSPLMKCAEVRRVESIPLLGTGKVDYKQLKKLI